MANIAERLRPVAQKRRIWLAGAALGLLAGFWLLNEPEPSVANTVEQTQVVEYRPFSVSIGFSGIIVANEMVVVDAPFDGKIKSLGFRYGDVVNAGQHLLDLETSELQANRNEAEGNLLKADQAYREMMEWESGPEVWRARRALSSTGADLNDLARKIAETKELLDRGLVARSEYDGLLQQQRVQQASLLSARDDLEATLERGKGANRRVAALDLANARSRYAKLSMQLASATVRSPATGIIIQPTMEKAGGDHGMIRVGMRLSEGQAIGSIVKTGSLGVAFQIDEADVNMLKPGTPVTVSGAGFGNIVLSGKIAGVAGEASTGAGTVPGKAAFDALVVLDPPSSEQVQQLRLGMTANISVVSYTNPKTIVLAPEAVQGAAPENTVSVRDKGGVIRRVSVQIGRVAADGVEILSGLKPGQVVIWHKREEPVPQM